MQKTFKVTCELTVTLEDVLIYLKYDLDEQKDIDDNYVPTADDWKRAAMNKFKNDEFSLEFKYKELKRNDNNET